MAAGWPWNPQTTATRLQAGPLRWSVGSYAQHVQSGRRRNHKRLSPGRLRRSCHRDRRIDHSIIFFVEDETISGGAD